MNETNTPALPDDRPDEGNPAKIMDGRERDDRPLRDRSLVYSLRDGMAWSVMIGFGDNYVGPFALFLSATTIQMGWLASLPPFIGAVSQIVAAHLTERIRIRRPIIVWSAAIQALMWMMLFAVPVLMPRSLAIPALIAIVILITTGGHFTVPAWMSLMGDLVPPDTRGTYFARRNRICQFLTMLSIVLAGWILQTFKSEGSARVPYGFLTIFAVACIGRLVSARYLFLQYEPPYAPPTRQDGGFLEHLRSLRGTDFGRFSQFMALMNFAVSLSGPFFVVYLLRDLGLTYLQFTIVTGMVVLSQILTLVFWGTAADRFGNKWALMTCGSVLALAPIALTCSTHVVFLAVFQFVISSVGAGFNLAAANYVFESLGPNRITRHVAYYHVTNATGVLFGGLFGGWLATHVPAHLALGALGVTFASSVVTVYLISAAFRVALVLYFRSRIQELRTVSPVPNARALVRMAVQQSDISRWLSPHR